MACFLLLVNLFLAVNAELPTIKINDVALKQTSSGTVSYMTIAEYSFYDNEMANVSCSVRDTSMMTLEVPDEPRLALTWANTTYISILIRMRTKPEKINYIDCYHNNSDVVSIVRIMLKQKPMDMNKDLWQIIINQQIVLRESAEYKYIPGEKINVTCEQNPHSKLIKDGRQSFKPEFVHNDFTLTEGVYTHKCPTKSSERGIQITYTEMNINGLEGLSSSNIIFLYNASDYLAIHYEYDGVRTLNLAWPVTVIAGKANEYKVFWKDRLVSLLPETTAQNDCKLKLSFNPFVISGEDDRSLIKFIKSITDDITSDHGETRIILRQRAHNIVADQKLDFNIVYIAIGVCGVFIIILISSILIIIKNKSKTRRNVTEENNYVNFDKESSSITPFPSQWDAYANTMVRTEPDMKNIHQLYTKPIPKSQRMKPEETNRSSDADEALYSEVQQFELLRDAAITMDRKDQNSYVNFKK